MDSESDGFLPAYFPSPAPRANLALPGTQQYVYYSPNLSYNVERTDSEQNDRNFHARYRRDLNILNRHVYPVYPQPLYAPSFYINPVATTPIGKQLMMQINTFQSKSEFIRTIIDFIEGK
jgi:hypothetical protein